jgi:hypothetical protein
VHFSVCVYTCANLHPRCRILFYTLDYGLTPKPTHACCTNTRTNPQTQTARDDPVTDPHPSATAPFPHPRSHFRLLTRSPFSAILAVAISPRRLRRRGVGGGVGLRQLLGISIYTRPFFLPPASTSCLLTHSSGSRSQTRLMRVKMATGTRNPLTR